MVDKGPLRIDVAAPPYRERHVAFLIDERPDALHYIAEIEQETGELRVEIYSNPDGSPQVIEYDRLMEGLERAKERLVNYDPSEFLKAFNVDIDEE